MGTVCASCWHRTISGGCPICDACGSPITGSDHTAEFKQVTVLFADVVRSMAIAAALDIERLREVMTELVARSAAVVRRYGGTVEHSGDGVMAIFGAPVALEDHAFAHVWPPSRSSTRSTAWRPSCSIATVSIFECGWAWIRVG